jgi:PKD repeat protein
MHFNLVDAGYNTNVNAFWNGSVMTYGDGDNTHTPLSTVDICAHEITHGLTSYTCDLNYQDESGAINEAFSDIFAVCVEFYAVPEYADWTIGEDIGNAFRSVSDPNSHGLPDTYQGDYWHFDASDNGGVHTNMGPLCYWFYMLSEGDSGVNDNGDSYNIDPLGMEAAAEITHRLQTVYLTNTSEYLDARFYAIQAAVDFYGACSDEVAVVTDAFYAIGVGDAFVPEVVADFDANYTENCVPPFTVQFYNYSMNGSSFEWNFGDGSTSTAVNPQHTYTTMGSFEVQLYTDGGTCGSDTETKPDFVSINASNPCMTFMPSTGNIVTDRCQGTLFDIGGPDDVYYNSQDASYTIHPDDATQIVLQILEFDIEPGTGATCDYDYIAFYDGINTSAPLINNTYYCNTNGNPGTIVSTGDAITIKFHSDAGLSLNGFEIAWQCMLSTDPPIANFSADVLNTCDGLIHFTDLSMNNPETYLWDFGDGTSSDLANPVHLYSESGTYTVSLAAINENGENIFAREDYIVVNLDDAIDVDNVLVCADSSFTLTVSGAGENLNWYSDTMCIDLVHTGSNWEHNPLQNDTSYYIRQFSSPVMQNIGATNNSSGGGYFGNPEYIHYLIFDAFQPFTLLSVSVNAQYAGTRYVALRDASMNVIEFFEVYCPAGESRVAFNLDVPAGEDMQLVGIGSPDLFRTNEQSFLNYPYSIDDVVSITGSSASNNPSGYYYYFYDWEVLPPTCESAPALMQVEVQDCATNIISNNVPSISVYPNPVSDLLQISGISNVGYIMQIQLIDISGRIIYEDQINQDAQIDIAPLPSGVYLLRIIGEGINQTSKVIKD